MTGWIISRSFTMIIDKKNPSDICEASSDLLVTTNIIKGASEDKITILQHCSTALLQGKLIYWYFMGILVKF